MNDSRSLNELTGKEVNEGIDTDSGGSMITNAGIDFYRLLTIRQALQAQMRGSRLSNKMPQGTTLARRHLGFRGNKESLLQQVNELIERIQAERQAEEARRIPSWQDVEGESEAPTLYGLQFGEEE